MVCATSYCYVKPEGADALIEIRSVSMSKLSFRPHFVQTSWMSDKGGWKVERFA